MADTQPAPQTSTTAFNQAAALSVYERNNTLVREAGIGSSIAGFFGVQNTDVNVDRTIKGSSIETNLDAIVAGYRGTTSEASVNSFANIIRNHPELRTAADAMLRDEGEKVLPAIANIFTGNGAIKPEDLQRMAESPAQRKMMADMMNAVSGSTHGADYATRFIRDGIDASQNPEDAAKRRKFLDTAAVAGIDTSGVQSEGAMNLIKNLFTGNNMESGIATFFDKLNLPPEMKEALTGMFAGVAQFFKEAGSYYAYGDPANNQRGLIEIGQEMFRNTAEAGRDIRREAGIPTAPAP